MAVFALFACNARSLCGMGYTIARQQSHLERLHIINTRLSRRARVLTHDSAATLYLQRRTRDPTARIQEYVLLVESDSQYYRRAIATGCQLVCFLQRFFGLEHIDVVFLKVLGCWCEPTGLQGLR